MLKLDFTPFPELKTERLLLRQLTLEDAPDIFLLRSDENVLRYIGREPAISIKEAEEFIQKIITNVATNESIMWAITFSDNPGKVIGNICYWRIQPENYRTEIGYALLPQYWRKGIMKEAILKVLEYGFETMKLHSIEARTNAENKPSGAILEATGFIKEAHLRDEFFFQGKFSDTIIYTRFQ
jgi:ribosomal-protein-alanine N-acetyltransferase